MSTMRTVDPYHCLGLPHEASAVEIKRAYHYMARKYHPDKYVQPRAGHPPFTEEEKQTAASHFADCAAAYALLTSPERKAEYDHIYKYGGFDDDGAADGPGTSATANGGGTNDYYGYNNNGPPHDGARANDGSFPGSRKKRRSFDSSDLGVGYACIDPFAVLYSQGRIQTKQAVCGVQIPSRFHSTGNIRFAFSSGNVVRSAGGTTRCTSRTTQFVQGRKSTRIETVTYHPDGLKEVIIEGDGGDEGGFQRRYYSQYTGVSRPKEHHLPWYVQAWKEIKDKLTVCYSPCATQQVVQ
jgi:curved DNA-binding protein CbpA